jgi:predicted AlkP superfamily pyrophosphatase or phosphodiesterase
MHFISDIWFHLTLQIYQFIFEVYLAIIEAFKFMKSLFLSKPFRAIRKIFITFILLLILLLISAGFTRDRRRPFKNYVLLVSLDGFRWDYSSLYKTPNINKIATDGVAADRLIPSFPTVTFPNHYTIATGLYPDHHGLIDNNFSAPDLGLSYRMSDRTAVENPSFYGGEPIWVTAEKQGAKAASFFWVGSEAAVGGIHPSYWKKYDGTVTYEARIDSVVKWLSFPREKRPELITLYFDEPDATSHKFGPNSPQAGKVVERLDSLIGVLRFKLSSLPYQKRINFILLSDHGMGAISSDRYINLKEVVPERMISSVYGGNPVLLINPVEGKLDSVLLLLNRHKNLKAWAKADVPARLHFGTNSRIPRIVVAADSSWSIGNRPVSASIRGGAHGYDNADSDMFAVFYAAGPAFKKNYRFHELNNTDIYGLICRILDIKPAVNDGNPENINHILK